MSDSAWAERLHRVPARHKQGFIWTVNYARSLRYEWRKNNVILARSFNHAQWNMMPFISMWQIWALVCIYIINVASAMSTSGAPNFQPPWPLTTPWTVMSGQMFVALTLRSNLARALCSCVAVFVFNYPSNHLHHSNLCSSSMLSETSWRLCEASFPFTQHDITTCSYSLLQHINQPMREQFAPEYTSSLRRAYHSSCSESRQAAVPDVDFCRETEWTIPKLLLIDL